MKRSPKPLLRGFLTGGPPLSVQVNDKAGVLLMAGETGHPTYYLDTDDIDASIAAVRELGGKADDKSPVPTHGWFAACTDSEGNAFHLWQADANAG